MSSTDSEHGDVQHENRIVEEVPVLFRASFDVSRTEVMSASGSSPTVSPSSSKCGRVRGMRASISETVRFLCRR